MSVTRTRIILSDEQGAALKIGDPLNDDRQNPLIYHCAAVPGEYNRRRQIPRSFLSLLKALFFSLIFVVAASAVLFWISDRDF